MKKKSIKRKILIGLVFITFINLLTLGIWFLCNVEPMLSKKEMLKKEILTKDIKNNYDERKILIKADVSKSELSKLDGVKSTIIKGDEIELKIENKIFATI